MLLHNQSPNALRWEMAPHGWFECQPWGAVDVPEKLVDAAKKLGLPLGMAPVAPEQKARRIAAIEENGARSDENRNLRLKLEASTAQLATSEKTLANVKADRARVAAELAASQKAGDEARVLIKTLEADKQSMRAEIAKQAERIVELEDQLTTPQRAQQPRQNKRR